MLYSKSDTHPPSDTLKGIFYNFPLDKNEFHYDSARIKKFFNDRKERFSVLEGFEFSNAEDCFNLAEFFEWTSLDCETYSFLPKCREKFPKDQYSSIELNQLEKISKKFQKEFPVLNKQF